MPYNTNSNLFFIHIPKTAGSSIEACLNMTEMIGGYKFEYVKNNVKIKCTSSPQHLTYAELEDSIDNLNDFTLFTVVRNPYDRVVSEYHFSYEHRLQNKYMLGLKSENITSFDDFIHFIFNKLTEFERRHFFDNHFVPQCEYVNDDVNIFKFESLDTLQNWLRIKTHNANLIIPHEMKNKTRKSFNSYFNNKNTKAIIEDYFQKDFEIFNYELIV